MLPVYYVAGGLRHDHQIEIGQKYLPYLLLLIKITFRCSSTHSIPDCKLFNFFCPIAFPSSTFLIVQAFHGCIWGPCRTLPLGLKSKTNTVPLPFTILSRLSSQNYFASAILSGNQGDFLGFCQHTIGRLHNSLYATVIYLTSLDNGLNLDPAKSEALWQRSVDY